MKTKITIAVPVEMKAEIEKRVKAEKASGGEVDLSKFCRRAMRSYMGKKGSVKVPMAGCKFED